VVRELHRIHRVEILLQAGSYFIEAAMDVSIHRRHDCRYIFLLHGLVMRIIAAPNGRTGS
jgi:hypothetical protein